MDEPVLRRDAGAVAWLTLNRPAQLNALDYPTLDGLAAALDAIEAEDAIRVVVLTGAGDKAFCAGADIKGFQPTVAAGPAATLRDFVRRGQRVTSRLENFPKPVIAAVNGLCLGGGAELMEACHLAIASERARFSQPEVKLGLVPCFGGSQRLPRLIGARRAKELMLLGGWLTAEQALAWGLVNRVAPRGTVAQATLDLARELAAKSGAASRTAKLLVDRGLDVDLRTGLELEKRKVAEHMRTDDAAAGLRAFMTRGRKKESR